MLQFRKVEKFYGAHLALTVPDLDLANGMYWIQGENGSGKTTFLKLLAGLHPFKGEIFLGTSKLEVVDIALSGVGEVKSGLLKGSDSGVKGVGVLNELGLGNKGLNESDSEVEGAELLSESDSEVKGAGLLSGSEKSLSLLKDRNEFLKKVNYAEAEPLYPPFLTAKDLVELYGATKKADIDAAKQQLEELHILDAYEQALGTYSSGMVKKLSLVLAFMGNPDWILLDEPLITIDVAAVELVCKWINDWHARKGISFLISSHQSFADGLNFTGKLSVIDKKLFINTTNS
jgi:ABC-2 type transport system ATP-binding protein